MEKHNWELGRDQHWARRTQSVGEESAQLEVLPRTRAGAKDIEVAREPGWGASRMDLTMGKNSQRVWGRTEESLKAWSSG